MKVINKMKIAMLALIMAIVYIINLPINTASAEGLFEDFSSDSYVLMDADSKTILYGKNAEQKVPVASICKLMTTLLTLEKIERGEMSLNTQVVASEYAASVEGSQAFLDAGSKYTVKDLLKSVIVASANDSAVVLAEAIGGNENNFVMMMNNRAKELGMKNTIYSNSTGLPKANQYSTAIDTAILLNKVRNYDIYKSDSCIWMDTLTHPSGRVTELVNTNRLIKYYGDCKCGKTGFTDEAGYCLSAVAERNNMTLIAVALNCDTSALRFKECMELFNYGFADFENKKLIDCTEVLSQEIKVVGGVKNSAQVIAEQDFYIVSKVGDTTNIEIKYELPNEIKAPMNSGDVVGKIIVLKKGVVVGEVGVKLKDDIKKQTYGDVLNKIFKNWEL